jgi:glycosyltransferase involved in cell wall biosynthesis
VLSEPEICEAYFEADGLVFLSLEESYGLPIVEAMHLGLPIVCPSLAYAEFLCGDEAIYFDPKDIRSFNAAILELERRLKLGWQPNWNDALNKIPKNWDEVADKILLEINLKLRS